MALVLSLDINNKSKPWTWSGSLVMDLHITHEKCGSRSDPSINGRLYCPNDLDGPLNETTTDKIRQYRAGYINRPSLYLL